MKAAVVVEPGAKLRLEERPIPEPKAGQVRVKVHACGVCRSDRLVVEALWPGIALPRVPGHEIAGVVDAVGPGVRGVEPGRRVGVGWRGGHCGLCAACREGDFPLCENGTITAISYDGGYQEHVVVPAESLASIPDGMGFPEAAPLLCAGVTTYNALRNAPARSGDLVAISGLGGLGHLGVQFARAMGFRVAALSRGTGKEDSARKLGAHEYIDTTVGDPAAALQAIGGAKVILATAPEASETAKLIPGLGREGCLLVVGAPHEPMPVSVVDLIARRRSIRGWPSGSAQDSTDTMVFAALHGVRATIETFPLECAGDAYAHMISGKVRFRAVIEP